MAKLLVVDDEPEMRQYMRAALMRAGHTVEVATDPANAVPLPESTHFDAILLDIDMPQMDGITFTRLLKQTPALLGSPDVPILLVTGRDDPGIMGESFDAGAQYFVKKPFSPRELIQAVRLAISA